MTLKFENLCTAAAPLRKEGLTRKTLLRCPGQKFEEFVLPPDPPEKKKDFVVVKTLLRCPVQNL